MTNNILKKYGGLKIIWHPEKLKSIKEGIVTAPIYVRVKPTNKCNHRCFYCSYDPEFEYVLSERLKREDEIPREKMMEILGDFKEMGVKAITLSGGGEPLIYPHIVESMKKCVENGIDLSIITNGQNLDGEKAEILKDAKWVRVSLDSIDSKTFNIIRRVPEIMFEKLISNLRNFAKIKNPKCEFGINFVVNDKNSNQIYEAVKFFKDIGVNHIKITPLYTPRNFHEYHAPFRESVISQIKRAKEEFVDENFAVFDTYENDFTLGSVHGRRYTNCPIMQIVPVIGADSCVYFCHDKSYTEDGLLGSLRDKSFKELWFSEEAKEKFKNFNPAESCKHHCTFDARNILINDAISCFGEHVNFI